MSNKRNLLIDEYPLLVLPSLAKMIGLNEAIALQQVHYWLNNPKGGVEIDGLRWVYNTYEEWQQDNFPFWSVSTVKRTFWSLESLGLVISRQQQTYDRKKYYRIDYAKLASWNGPDCIVPSGQNEPMEGRDLAPSLTETTTETTQINKDGLIRVIDIYGPSVFSNDSVWWNFRRRLESDDQIRMTGDEKRIIVTGLSRKIGEYTEAEVWSSKYCKSFANLGLELVFTE